MDGATTSRSLLIVDGDHALRGQLAVAMARQEFRVRTAVCVREARVAIDAQVPAFAILDLRFRDGSGPELAERILRNDNGARVVILTGFGDIQTAVAATRLCVTDYLTKPATPDEIIDALVVADGTYPPAPRATVSPDEARNHHIAHVFRETGRNITQTARRLNVHRRTLQRIVKRNGVLKNATG
jgi:two-component system response regulator RegA